MWGGPWTFFYFSLVTVIVSASPPTEDKKLDIDEEKKEKLDL